MAKQDKSVNNFPNLRFPGFEDEWEVKKLGDICKMQAGKFVTASEISASPNVALFPCYGGNGLRGYTRSFNYDGRYSLIGRQGALCGNVTFTDGKFHATEHAVVVTPTGEIETEWMFSLLKFLNLNQYATGMAQPGLSVQNLGKIEVIVPKSTEQKKISSLLSLIDERISKSMKIISHLETSIRSYREKIFSQKFRFKDKLGNNFADWKDSKLENICQKQSSNISANKIEENFGSYTIYGASGILKKVDFYEEENEFVSIVKDGAGVGRLFLCEAKSSVLGTMDIIKPKPDVNIYFLFYQLSNIDFTKYVTGSTIPHIYFRDYKKEKLKIPSNHEQTKIANFLFSIDEKIEIEKKILKQYENQKKHLLTNLFV